MAQVLNQSFEDWSSTRKFPFTDKSDMTCQDGRRIPVSMFTMISLCPDIDGTAEIHSIDTDGIHFRISGWTADALFVDYADQWIPVMRYGNCVGTVMFPDDRHEAYLKEMTAVKTLVFSEGHLVLRPEVVKGFCLSTPALETPPVISGYPAQEMTVTYDSPRFLPTPAYGEGSWSVDTTPIVLNETEPIESIVLDDSSEPSGEKEYPLSYPGNLVLRTPQWCDTQFIPGDESIVFHQRGS